MSVYKTKRKVPSGSFSIAWSMESSLDSRTSMEDAGIDWWNGDLKFYDFNAKGEDEPEKKIGYIKAIKVTHDLDPSNYAYVFDCHSGNLAPLADLFDGDLGDVKEGIRNEVGEDWEITQGTKLYIDHIQVDEEFRGLGLGLFMVDEACRKINDGMSLTVLIPAPMDRNQTHMSETDRRDAIRHLRAYYGLLGFRALGEQFVGRWNGYVTPPLTQVCPHLFGK